jgi:hypothetical protein
VKQFRCSAQEPSGNRHFRLCRGNNIFLVWCSETYKQVRFSSSEMLRNLLHACLLLHLLHPLQLLPCLLLVVKLLCRNLSLGRSLPGKRVLGMLAPTCGYFSSTSNSASISLECPITSPGVIWMPNADGCRDQPATVVFSQHSHETRKGSAPSGVSDCSCDRL